jgi:hypothetical protein
MRDLPWHRSRALGGFFLSAAACLASGATLAQSVPVTRFITVQPWDMCSPICAPFNTTSQIGKPTTQNSTTNPIGFVYNYTDNTGRKVYIDITRALLNQIGVDVTWLPMKQYPGSSGQPAFPSLSVVTNNTACGISGNGIPATGLQSCDFLKLSQQPCISRFPNPNPSCTIASPLSSPATVINMFFVTQLNPPTGQTGGQLYGFSWVDNNGVAIGSNTFFPPAPLTPLVDVLAHELGHNLGLDHIHWGSGPYNPITVDPEGGALQGTSSTTVVGECDSGYPACMANLMTAGNLRTIPTVNCVAVSNPPLPGQTACPGAPSLANGTADQLTTKAQQWTGLPVSQQFVVTDPSGFLQPIPESTTTVSVPANSSSMTVSITGGATGGTQQKLLEWVLVLPSTSPLKLNSQFHTISQSRRNLLQDWELDPDSDNAPNKTYAMGSLYDLCSAPNSECLILEFNLPGFAATDQITFSKGFTTTLTTAQLCGATITSIFSHGYMTTSQLSCPGGVVPPGGLTASSLIPDLTASDIVTPQIVNQATFNAVASLNQPCTLGSQCQNPETTGVSDAKVSEEKQICYFHGQPVPCP